MRFLAGGFLAAAGAIAAEPPAAPVDGDAVYDAAKQLFDQYAPPEVKAQVDFPSRDQFTDFAARLQQALSGGSLDDLAGYQSEAESVLALLRASPADADYADWLAARLEEIEVARSLSPPGATRGLGTPNGSALSPGPAPPGAARAEGGRGIPYYDQWLARVRGRSPPRNAAQLMPRLRAAFAAEGVPAELAWLAEAESSLNPTARSPAGASGLFQLEPATARQLGLSTFLPDQRTDPDKSAHAAARELRTLGVHFGSWPLAIAAYNAGEGRVGRTLAARHAADYAGIAGSLPAETRMYVPEVCALMAVRAGVAPDQLPAPR
jgi:membrane-bound lytic murein transglycosylase D